MALLTNASTSYDIKTSGTEEDVIDIKEIVYNISPTETPFVNSVGTRNVSNTVFEWITEELSATSTTTDLEGNTLCFCVFCVSRAFPFRLLGFLFNLFNGNHYMTVSKLMNRASIFSA